MDTVYYYSIAVVLGICALLFLLILLQKKREEERKRRELEYLTAQRRLESSRDHLNSLRKKLYDVENLLSDNKHYFNTKKEELIQLAKKLSVMEEDRDRIKVTLVEGAVPEGERNLLNNRLKLSEDNIAEVSTKAAELQEQVNGLENASRESEKHLSTLQGQIAQAESELEYNKELVKIKERMISR
jgi:peptidoglycan hydrolase CwlO-like protein